MRRGFTLIELMVALLVTALVVSLAYGALQAGLETRDRLALHRAQVEAETTLRSMISDAVRHALPGIMGGPSVFVLTDRVNGAGAPQDSLSFATRGIEGPLGTSAAWSVALFSTGSSLRFVATPADRSRAPVTAELTGLSSLDVQVLGRGRGAEWRSEWPGADVAPEAVRLTISGPSTLGAPIVARVGLERAL